LFQKVADSKGSAFGRHPQMAERSILQAYLGVWGPLQEKGPQGPSQFHLSRRETASPMGRWRAAPEGVLAICFPAPSGGFGGVPPPWNFPASCRRGCRVPPRQAGSFLVQTRKE